jgi:hypothetical protein
MKTFKQYRVDTGALCDSGVKDLQQIRVISMAINIIEIKAHKNR